MLILPAGIAVFPVYLQIGVQPTMGLTKDQEARIRAAPDALYSILLWSHIG